MPPPPTGVVAAVAPSNQVTSSPNKSEEHLKQAVTALLAENRRRDGLKSREQLLASLERSYRLQLAADKSVSHDIGLPQDQTERVLSVIERAYGSRKTIYENLAAQRTPDRVKSDETDIVKVGVAEDAELRAILGNRFTEFKWPSSRRPKSCVGFVVRSKT
jgi:hypothetical protein